MYTDMVTIGFTIVITSILAVWIVKSIGLKHGWVATVRKDRWHQKIAALHGGVGFIPVIIVGLLYLGYSGNYIGATDYYEMTTYWQLIIGASILFLAGLIDDIWQINPLSKISVQSFVAILFIWSTYPVYSFTSSALINNTIVFIWIVGIINSINLLDNMDGLSAGIVIIIATTIILLSVLSYPNIPVSFYIAIILVCGVMGFFTFNFPPASIFMGDSGSLSLGYMLAILSLPTDLNLKYTYLGFVFENTNIQMLLVPILVMAVPIFDTSFVTLSRISRSVKISQGGRDHTSHMLVSKGLSEKHAISVLYILSIIGGSIVISSYYISNMLFTGSLIYALILTSLGLFLNKRKSKIENG